MSKLANLVFILILCLTSNTFAAIYKCDDNGKISYQDSKCSGGSETIPQIPNYSTTNTKTNVNSNDPAKTNSSPPPATSSNQPATSLEQPADNLNNSNQEQPTLSPEQMQQVQQLLNNMPKPIQ